MSNLVDVVLTGIGLTVMFSLIGSMFCVFFEIDKPAEILVKVCIVSLFTLVSAALSSGIYVLVFGC